MKINWKLIAAVLGSLLVASGIFAQHSNSNLPTNLSENTGRFQVVTIHWSTASTGTGVIDSATGKVWVFAGSSDDAAGTTSHEALFEIPREQGKVSH